MMCLQPGKNSLVSSNQIRARVCSDDAKSNFKLSINENMAEVHEALVLDIQRRLVDTYAEGIAEIRAAKFSNVRALSSSVSERILNASSPIWNGEFSQRGDLVWSACNQRVQIASTSSNKLLSNFQSPLVCF
jgi:hypothetical protein